MNEDLYTRIFGAPNTAGPVTPDPYAWGAWSTRFRTWDVDGNELTLPGPSLPVDLVPYLGGTDDSASLSGRNVRELSVTANEGYVRALRDHELGKLVATASQMRCFEEFVYALRKRPSATLLIG